MSDLPPLGRLVLQLTLLSSIGFGGIPSVLPDIRNLVVVANHWMTDQEFANFFAVSQAMPGPGMLLMMGLIGWKIAGLTGAAAAAFAAVTPPCTMYFISYSLWDRFRDAPWQRIVRGGLAPLTIGLVIAGGTVIARATDTSWTAVGVTATAAALLLLTRINPLWLLGAGGVLGGLGVL
jgi:chromate transporter